MTFSLLAASSLVLAATSHGPNTTALPTLVPPGPPAVSADGADDTYEAMALKFLDEFGYAGPDDFELESFLETHFLRARIGVFDLHIPVKSIGEGTNAKDFELVAQSLMGLQGTFLEWTAPGADRDELLLEDVKLLESWVKSWSPAKLKGANAGDLYLELSADEETQAAAERFSRFMGNGGPLDLERDEPEIKPIVLLPDRGSYVRSIALSGLLNSGAIRAACWSPGSVKFTQHQVGIDLVDFIAMRYADPAATLNDYDRGTTMNWRSDTGLRQQVTQIAAIAMFDSLFGEALPASLVGGLSLDLVIEIFGECNTRVDGDLNARRTDAREFFVPGGLSEGGRLPPNMADSRWREHGSKGRFTRILKEAQKAGGKKGRSKKDKLCRFELQGVDRVQKMFVEGPFLGSSANPEYLSVPDAFYGDQLEFLRAYRCAFVYYLRQEAFKKSKDSEAAFADLLRNIAGLEDPEQLEKVVAEAYKASALSTADLDGAELEMKFMRWISKQ